MIKMSLKQKLYGILSFVLFLLILISGISYFYLENVVAEYDHVASINLVKNSKLTEMFNSVMTLRGHIYRIILFYDNKQDRTEHLNKIENEFIRFEKLEKEYVDIPFVGGEDSLYKLMHKEWVDYKDYTLKMVNIAKNDTSDSASEIKVIAKNYISSKFKAAYTVLADFQTKEAAKWASESKRTANQASVISLLISILGVLLCCIVGVVFVTRLSRNLNQITSSVNDSSLYVNSASMQLTEAAFQLSTSSQQQYNAVNQTFAELKQIISIITENKKAADTTNELVKSAQDTSTETRDSMNELAKAMIEIHQGNQRIVKLVKIIEEIGVKTKIIDDIVFKTQLLSFNASIEAQRAGEHGRGFAVVAQEVGNLAQMSGKAALEIASIVKESIHEAESVANDNKLRVETGGKLANDTKDKMNNVLDQLSTIVGSLNKMVSASNDQEVGIKQISINVEEMSRGTKTASAAAEEAASSSVELTKQAKFLMGLVGELQIIVKGEADLNNPEARRKTNPTSNTIQHENIIKAA